MLRWAADLVPDRAGEMLTFLRPYADFLLNVQHPWRYSIVVCRRTATAAEFRDFNAETAGSALFLARILRVFEGSEIPEGRQTSARVHRANR